MSQSVRKSKTAPHMAAADDDVQSPEQRNPLPIRPRESPQHPWVLGCVYVYGKEEKRMAREPGSKKVCEMDRVMERVSSTDDDSALHTPH
ncbi:hypothetical protein KC19_1G143100 [Ceratodon purpureus]|uniref:Uncharacterized protein n=1 Tax=Ceratodon purpureus TaxID=3225 RepID=A0A8T0J843_CERPU|nr:hypothetical protein KC19_1G143100 [Ceratodon purpureus]